VPLEVKLGNNVELAHDVRDQVNRYWNGSRALQRLSACYERVYDRDAPRFDRAGPERVHLVRDTEGMVHRRAIRPSREAIAELHDHSPRSAQTVHNSILTERRPDRGRNVPISPATATVERADEPELRFTPPRHLYASADTIHRRSVLQLNKSEKDQWIRVAALLRRTV